MPARSAMMRLGEATADERKADQGRGEGWRFRRGRKASEEREKDWEMTTTRERRIEGDGREGEKDLGGEGG